MSPKPKARNWTDVQTVIATVAIVTTLGMWNLFATPAKTETVQVEEPTVPPTELPFAAEPTPVPQIKIMFTDATPQTVTNQQPENNKKKKKNNNNNNGGGSVTQTKTS
jgi:hypothetical protein